MELLLLGALKKAMDERDAAYSSNSGKVSSKGEYSSGGSSYTPTYSEYEYMMGIIKKDPVLEKFFEIIVEEGKKIDEIDEEKIRKGIEEKIAVQDEKLKKLEELKNEIKESGLEVETDRGYCDYVTVGVLASKDDKNKIDDKWKYVLTTAGIGLKYNGTSLSKYEVNPEKEGISCFEHRYNEWVKEHENVEDEIKKVEGEINKLEGKLEGKIIIDKEKKTEQLDKLKKEHSRLLYFKKDGEEKKRDKENFDKITPEQKKKLYEYFKFAEGCEQIGKEIDLEKQVYLNITQGEPFEYSKNTQKRKKWPRTIKLLKERGELTEEILDAVDAIFSEEKFGQEKYEEGIHVGNKDLDDYKMSKELKTLVEWYLNERGENICTKAYERKIMAYKVLEEKCINILGSSEKDENNKKNNKEEQDFC